MKTTVRPEVKILYPRAVFGSLKVYNQKNTRQDQRLEDRKRALEEQIRNTYPDPREDSVIQSYNDYYGKWEKTYPIEYQIKSLKSGRKFPRVSVHVDAMFMAELGNRILTSGHDQEAIKGDPVFDLADEGEPYTKLNGEEQSLKKNDVVLRDEEGGAGQRPLRPGAENLNRPRHTEPPVLRVVPQRRRGGSRHKTPDRHRGAFGNRLRRRRPRRPDT